MEEELEKQRQYSVYLCDRLLNELNKNKDAADSFLGGDIYRAYVDATEAAMNKVKKTKRKIQNL